MALPLKQGWLYKYRNKLKGWKKYYFKLESSYLHYFETEHSPKPKGTTTRGEINELTFTKPHKSTNFGFAIHLKYGSIWYLESERHEERMLWMRSLQPNTHFVDPFQNCESGSYSHVSPTITSQQQQFDTTPVPDSPPPAYDDII